MCWETLALLNETLRKTFEKPTEDKWETRKQQTSANLWETLWKQPENLLGDLVGVSHIPGDLLGETTRVDYPGRPPGRPPGS